MPLGRRIRAVFNGSTPRRVDGGAGILLAFQPMGARIDVDRIDDYADLGPALTVPAVLGLGKVLRLLRAGRIARPREPLALVGHEHEAAELLERVAGTVVWLELRRRSRMRFIAWMDHGVETVTDVVDVVEREDAFYVKRRYGRMPVRMPRDSVIRQRTESQRWYEVLDIERA